MEIYIAGPRLVMICDTPLDFQWDEAMARLATLPRQQEWKNTWLHSSNATLKPRATRNGR
jgi:hypothetical protein